MSDFSSLVRQGDDLYARYEAQGNHSDLSLSIMKYRSALTLATSATDLSSDARSKLFGNLANVLSIRFQCHGDVADLDNSIECHLAALDLRPQGHPGRANALSNFATALLVRYGQLGVQKDIELAIEHFNTALPLLPLQDRLMPRMNYASALFSRFQYTGSINDINDAISQYRTVAEACQPENKASSYYNLANALLSRSKLNNDTIDLDLCIEYSSIALHDIKSGHMDHPLILSCLATALVRRFESQGHPMDLEMAINHFQSALDLRSTSSQYTSFSDLADALVLRYKLNSELSDLEVAIQHYRTALELIPSGSKCEALILDNLGNALFLRLTRLGHPNDLEEAIGKYILALALYSDDSSRRVTTCQALAACLDVRFEQMGNPADLRTAIDLYNEALIETSHDHPQRATILHNTATCLETRFRLFGEIVDLNRSISYCHEALELLPSNHVERGACCYILASSLFLRFEEEGDEFDLDQAHFHCGTSMNMPYASDTSHIACDLLFARILKARLLPWSDVKEIEQVFHHLRSAKDFCTLSHPLISDVYAEYASAYYLRFLLEKRPSDLKEAFSHHELSLNVAGGPSSPAFRTSLQWIKDVETYDHCSGVDVYHTALRLADRYVLTTRSSDIRQSFVRRYVGRLSLNAASISLRFREAVEAVEVLEGGRSTLWDQLVRGTTSLDDLRTMGTYGASLADDFERLSFQLEHVPKILSKTSKDIKPLLKERETVLEQIRRVEGFRSFLKPLSISQFDKAAIDGPVIIVNAGQTTCDAVIVLYTASPIHVPLQITPREVSCMAMRFRELTERFTVHDTQQESIEELLTELWYLVVYPIIQLLVSRTPRGSRLWWCPTGKFTSIPLHAAGPYKTGEPSLSQVYVSSYTPTLQALIRARVESSSDAQRSRRSANFVPSLFKRRSKTTSSPTSSMPTIVGIGHTIGGGTCDSLELLRNRLSISPGVSFRYIEGDEATSEAVLNAFREPTWLHLASPASLDPLMPFQSGFATRDGKLTMYDISKVRPQAQFAFVSGLCNRGENTPLDEMMHFAASLQYSGVRSVVGTLWPVDEEAMCRVSSVFYEDIILKTEGMMQHTNAARSLNEALKRVEHGVPLAQRIAFVHIGA